MDNKTSIISKSSAIFLSIVLIICSVSVAVAIVAYQINNTGKIIGINILVYASLADMNTNTTMTQIDWGNIATNQTVSKVIIVKNTGTENLVLSYASTGLPEYLYLDWNGAGQILPPDGYLITSLNLTANPLAQNHIAEHFTFITTLIGTSS